MAEYQTLNPVATQEQIFGTSSGEKEKKEMRQKITKNIGEKLGNAEALLTTECCIYRVPHEIRKFSNDAYTPTVISIGPFHCGNYRLRKMQNHKLIYCKRFIEGGVASLDSLVSCVQESEPDVRHCYSESIKLSMEEFVALILVDCCFIFELFLTHFPKEPPVNVIPFEGWLQRCIAYDLLLLENQLPFFILDKLYTQAFPSSFDNNPHPSFEHLILHFFLKKCNLQLVVPTTSMKHFTDLLRISHLPPPHSRPEPERVEKLRQIYSATLLDAAGVKFRVKKKEGHSLDLKFSEHYLEIPELDLGDNTEILFRNMMALEQCHYFDQSYITEFVVVLNYLINTSSDVDVLVRDGIIINKLGNTEAVPKLFNDLNKNIALPSFYSEYGGLSKELEEYCNNRSNKAKAFCFICFSK